MATEWAELIPTDVARDVISAAESESAVLALGNTIVMPAGVVSVPVVSVAPQAVFVGVGAPARSTCAYGPDPGPTLGRPADGKSLLTASRSSPGGPTSPLAAIGRSRG